MYMKKLRNLKGHANTSDGVQIIVIVCKNTRLCAKMQDCVQKNTRLCAKIKLRICANTPDKFG